MNPRKTLFQTLLVTTIVLLAGWSVTAQDVVEKSPEKSADAAAAEVEPADTKDETDAEATDDDSAPSAADVEKQLDELIPDNPVIEPADQIGAGTTVLPPARVESDPRVLGTAPGLAQPKLRREGEFVINRRGRLAHGSEGGQPMFIFDADDTESPEPPMLLMPCQLLQNMESLVAERGDKSVFILSGQIFTYRGANYLLPTTMKLAIDKGNLQP